MHKGIKPHDAEEAVGYATHWGLCHYSVKPDAWRSSQLWHTEENQQKSREVANELLEGKEGNC